MASTINSDNGVVSGSAGLKYASDNSGVLALQTNGNTAVTIDTSGNMGVGTVSPGVNLDVYKDTNAGTYIRVNNPNAGGSAAAKVYFGNNLNSSLASIGVTSGSANLNIKNDAGYPITFNIGSTQAAVFNTYGIGLGATTPSSGMGIAFPATQSASSDPNTLDDYEEGTWTPTCGTASGFTSGTVTNINCNYVKIGRTVVIYANFILSASSGNVAVGDRFYISGLPFTSTSTSNASTPFFLAENLSAGVFASGTGYVGTSGTIYYNTVCQISGSNPRGSNAILASFCYLAAS
jgi:hypothetical protein